MTYFASLRLDFIDWRLLNAGAIRRADIVEKFGVSPGQASVDLAAFERAHPEAIIYDRSAKQYIPRAMCVATKCCDSVRGARLGPMVVTIAE